MLLVFVLVFAGYGAALAAGYGLRRFVKPYDRFMPLLMTSAEGGMLGYALYALLCGADQTKTYAMVDIGQTVFAYTVFLTALKAAGGEKMTPKFIMKNIVTNKGCIGMLSGIVLGGFIGSLASSVPFLSWLNFGQSFGLNDPLVLDLGVLIITFGLSIKITLASLIGVVLALIVYRFI